MGTSQTSQGPGSGTPMVPPWTPNPIIKDESELEGQAGMEDEELDERGMPGAPSLIAASLLAPWGRFQGARRAIGEYARTGDSGKMKRGIGWYVRKGYGGSSTATRRFGGTAATAQKLYLALSDLATGQLTATESPLDPNLLAGQDAEVVISAVAGAVCPVNGTLDAEAERVSIKNALSKLYTEFPDADILNLDSDQREYVIEEFTAISVFSLFQLDMETTIKDKAPSATIALDRLNEVENYIIQCVRASFRELSTLGYSMKSNNITQIAHLALKQTFEVFEDYLA